MGKDLDRGPSKCVALPPRRLAYSTGSTATQPTGHAGWGDADFSLVGNNEAELQEGAWAVLEDYLLVIFEGLGFLFPHGTECVRRSRGFGILHEASNTSQGMTFHFIPWFQK